MTEETIFEESSGNVFADLGLADADELFARGKIGIQVLRLLKQRNLEQREMSELLGIPQPEVSHLMNGEFQRFSEGKLLLFLKRLDTEIILHPRDPSMELKKQFTFSGIFKKFHEEDTQPIEINDANIYCYVNGNIWIELNSQVNQHINHKRFYECAPIYQFKDVTREQVDLLSFSELEGLEREMVQQAYEGDYEIEGKTVEGWKIKAIIADANLQVTFGVDNSENIEEEGKSQVRLRDLDIDYNLDSLEEGGSQEIVYGLANIEVRDKFSAQIGNLEAEMCIESVSTRDSRNKSGILSAEMTLRNIPENEDSYETYCAWLISVLSLASGHCVDKIYRIKAVRYEHFQIKSEYWSGRKLHSEARGIAVIHSPDLYLFMQQCAKKLTSETFSDKGVGLALTWYIDTFVSPMAEVNFLLLCTVLESLKEAYFSKDSKKKLLPKNISKKIREKILKVVSDFQQEIDNPDVLEKYNIFSSQVRESCESGSYNKIKKDLRTSLQEMFKIYSVPYEDLFPGLEFIKIRNDIVHKGFYEVDLALERYKLSNLVVRVFLAILRYNGNYNEYIKIEIDDPLGQSKYKLIRRSFPFIASEDNTESNSIDTCC